MAEKPRFTIHMTPAVWLERFDPSGDYVPPHYDREGFIHCTDGAENMVKVANRLYKADPRDFLALLVDKSRVKSPIKYEDPDEIYPHIYGPLNLDAVVARRATLRQEDGAFLVEGYHFEGVEP